MQRKIKMPMLAAIAGVVLAVGVSAFTQKATHRTKSPTSYFYTYVGGQNQADRENGANYTSPSESPLSCASGTVHECGVEVAIPQGTPAPADISGLSITYASGSGFPDGGGDLQANFLKDTQ